MKFSDSFWTADYTTGVDVLFKKLRQGCVENEEVLNLVRMRAETEEAYGLKLEEVRKSSVKNGGFMRDDGASTKKAFDGIRKEMEEV